MATFTGTLTFEMEDGSTEQYTYIGSSSEATVDVDVTEFARTIAPEGAARYHYAVSQSASYGTEIGWD
jgi:hypothetical protein